MVLVVAVLIVNVVVEILYVLIDPRLRVGQR
jgi:ABC-type dipeptide/oligopeptide/nickel transport system permease component